MPFNYYHRLSGRNKKIYRRSDEIATVPLPDAAQLQRLIPEIEAALATEKPRTVRPVSQALADGITSQLQVPALEVKVLAVRPSKSWGELHGLYEPGDNGDPARIARITLWMRTAKHKRVVAFRTYLRTLLHELLHHLDYELFELADSFHTEGFFKRESSLFGQLVVEQDS